MSFPRPCAGWTQKRSRDRPSPAFLGIKPILTLKRPLLPSSRSPARRESACSLCTLRSFITEDGLPLFLGLPYSDFFRHSSFRIPSVPFVLSVPSVPVPGGASIALASHAHTEERCEVSAAVCYDDRPTPGSSYPILPLRHR